MYQFKSRVLPFVLGTVIAGAALIPAYASAAVINLTNATTSSSNASTTLAKIGDTVSFTLNLSGTPSATTTPVISLFNFGSTSMSGAGAVWTYSTTSNAGWTEGAIPFQIGWGGSLGESTTTFQSVASTTLVNVVFDKTAPTIQTTTAATSNASTTIAKIGDVVTLSFLATEPIKTPTVTIQGNTATVLATTTLARFWTASTTILNGNTAGSVFFSISAPVDQAGNASSTAQTVLTTPSSIRVFSTYPQVTLQGSSPDQTDQTNLFPYSEPGATAVDAFSTPLTVSETGHVDRTTAGTYTLTYSATDAANNVGSTTRTVTVSALSGHFSGGSSGGGGGGGSAHTVVYSQTPTSAQTSTTQSTTQTMSGSVTTTMSGSFTRSLQAGATGADVKSLQQWLNSHGYTVSVSGAGSVGNETMYFGAATRAALAKFQAAVGISPAVGYFGPITRAYLAAHATTSFTTGA